MQTPPSDVRPATSRSRPRRAPIAILAEELHPSAVQWPLAASRGLPDGSHTFALKARCAARVRAAPCKNYPRVCSPMSCVLRFAPSTCLRAAALPRWVLLPNRHTRVGGVRLFEQHMPRRMPHRRRALKSRAGMVADRLLPLQPRHRQQWHFPNRRNAPGQVHDAVGAIGRVHLPPWSLLFQQRYACRVALPGRPLLCARRQRIHAVPIQHV